MICLVVEGKDKFLSSKLDTLHKHVGWKKYLLLLLELLLGIGIIARCRNPSFGPGTKGKGVVRLRAKRKPRS